MENVTETEKKIIMDMRRKASETVRPFVLMNAELDREEFEVVAREKFAAYLERDERERGASFDAIDEEWSKALWRAMWREWFRIHSSGGGGSSAIN